MLSVKHFVCCGMDVHKKFVVATIAITDYRGVTSYIKRKFATFNSDLKTLKKWLFDHNCSEVCMESTGKYWIPVFNILEDSCHVVVANPKYVRAIKGQKTDDKDSAWIADLFKFDIVPSSYIPCREIRALRELFQYRQKLIGHRSSEKTVSRTPLPFPILHSPLSSQTLLVNQQPPLLIISLPVRCLTRNTANPCS